MNTARMGFRWLKVPIRLIIEGWFKDSITFANLAPTNRDIL